jgi:spore maturation protein CgeB
METVVHDVRLSSQAPRWAVAAAWRWGRRPPRLGHYGKTLLERCEQFRPRVVLCIGIAPVSQDVLLAVQKMGITVLDYLTDDPWNPGRYASWSLKALRHYDHIFSPRRANLEDLERHGCRAVSYLPFGYSEEMHVGSDGQLAEEDHPGLILCS